jgi:hypothetical protein
MKTGALANAPPIPERMMRQRMTPLTWRYNAFQWKKVSCTEQTKKGFRFISRNASSILVVSLLLSLLSLLYTWQEMEFLTGRDDLMPKNTQFHADYRAYRQEFGDMDEIVVVMESDDQEKAARFGEMLYQKLSRDRKNFSDVFYPYGLPFFKKNGLLHAVGGFAVSSENIVRLSRF